jgi:hypothetical protein
MMIEKIKKAYSREMGKVLAFALVFFLGCGVQEKMDQLDQASKISQMSFDDVMIAAFPCLKITAYTFGKNISYAVDGMLKDTTVVASATGGKGDVELYRRDSGYFYIVGGNWPEGGEDSQSAEKVILVLKWICSYQGFPIAGMESAEEGE